MDNTEAILFQAAEEYGVDLMIPCRHCGTLQLDCSCLEPDFDFPDVDSDDALYRQRLEVPKGWVVWMDCNSPGCIFVGAEENFDYHKINGSSPVHLSAAEAFSYMNGLDGTKWNLHICGSLGASEKEEIRKFNEMWT